jgi:ABC-2 type transport system permease protein
MSNVIAIAQKELKAYFASPIAYIVIGFFAALYGFFYNVMLRYFLQTSLQMSQFGGGPQSANVNEMMIRPLMQNILIMVLFIVPMVTMRTYAEEKRSGTMELLLTSPLTDLQIVFGKFIGAMTLYAATLAVTLIPLGVLFLYGRPEWKPILTSYLGLFLFGGCFVSAGMFISSLTKNQIIAGSVSFFVFLLLWVIDWIGSFAPPTVAALTSYLSVVQHVDDFWKGVIDTTHLIYYLSFMAFGLFLTAKSLDTERWRG